MRRDSPNRRGRKDQHDEAWNHASTWYTCILPAEWVEWCHAEESELCTEKQHHLYHYHYEHGQTWVQGQAKTELSMSHLLFL